MPAYVTAENVKFNGTTDNAVVLKNTAGVRSLILWDKLSTIDQNVLDALIVSYGGVVPLAGPTAGKLTFDYKGTVVGTNPTGLSNISATAGFATVNVGGAVAGATVTGLPTSGATAGSQTVNFSVTKTGASVTGLNVSDTAGYQDVNVGGVATTGAVATNLVAGTTYTATVTVDGAAKPISTLGSAAATYTALLGVINTALGASGTASLLAGNIHIVSATTGATSSVAITAGTLFAAPLNGFVAVVSAVAGTAVTYTATIVVDGVSKPVSTTYASAGTFTALLAVLNTALGAAGTAAIVGGEIKVTSSTVGLASKVAITPGTLFPALLNYVKIFPAANGGGVARTFSAIIVVDGVLKSVRVAGAVGNNYTNLLTKINTDLGGAATAAITGGNIVITSATTGAASSVAVYDIGSLFQQLTGYAGIVVTKSSAPVTYTTTLLVDGVAKPMSVVGTAVQTFTALVAAINTALGASATAAITGGNIVVTSATTGAASSVTLLPGTLFKNTPGYSEFYLTTPGAADLLTLLQGIRTANGSTFAQRYNIVTVGTKPVVLPNTPRTTRFIYFNGTVWKYLIDDTNV
jgi:flagellin